VYITLRNYEPIVLWNALSIGSPLRNTQRIQNSTLCNAWALPTMAIYNVYIIFTSMPYVLLFASTRLHKFGRRMSIIDFFMLSKSSYETRQNSTYPVRKYPQIWRRCISCRCSCSNHPSITAILSSNKAAQRSWPMSIWVDLVSKILVLGVMNYIVAR